MGKTTLEAHGVPLTPEQQAMGVTSQIVPVLASTMSSPSTTAIFVDNFFTSMELVRYLRDQNCRWKDNRKVYLLSTDMGVEPMSSVIRYCSETKTKEPVSCPAVIRTYNANMGGIDKSDMLVHLYRNPMKCKRWYMRMFAYVIDVSLTNAWIMYRQDCKALGVNGVKSFRIQVFRAASNQWPVKSSSRRSSSSLVESVTVADPQPVPNVAVRFDPSLFHAPVHANRLTCKYCSRKGNIVRSNVVCRVCKVHLCMNAEHNCCVSYHEEFD
ncbi:hypothetical protein CesoFtcFv8_017024 [Champsocephalus esox]|uniref:PiggyBac transposable element-derived protein domain-containing protein n=1 Tax=Champsocephalus esox TaxID=159716 RepID=A0AAN8GQB3_9TELE|nr:hypothetical protein CesoFtcFv8_017024 [Champsocephalus esox]